MDVVISEQCEWYLLLQCLHLWETKYPTCGSLIQISDVITMRLQFLDPPKKIFHFFIVLLLTVQNCLVQMFG